MKIDILTLFPKMFSGPFDESIVKRAVDKKIVQINIHNLRDWATDKRKTVDDRPYGGGKGMILKVDVIDRAIQNLKSKILNLKSKTILLTPQGKTFNQTAADKLAKLDHFILICGHYEGFDERVRKLIDLEVSIGNYVLTGGELPAMVLTDTIVRLLPGVLSSEATTSESFSSLNNLKLSKPCLPAGKSQTLFFDFPQYTRPEVYKNMKVPKTLLSGDHKKIEKWRKNKQKKLEISC